MRCFGASACASARLLPGAGVVRRRVRSIRRRRLDRRVLLGFGLSASVFCSGGFVSAARQILRSRLGRIRRCVGVGIGLLRRGGFCGLVLIVSRRRDRRGPSAVAGSAGARRAAGAGAAATGAMPVAVGSTAGAGAAGAGTRPQRPRPRRRDLGRLGVGGRSGGFVAVFRQRPRWQPAPRSRRQRPSRLSPWLRLRPLRRRLRRARQRLARPLRSARRRLRPKPRSRSAAGSEGWPFLACRVVGASAGFAGSAVYCGSASGARSARD